MLCKYGSYSHTAGEAALVFSQRPVFERGRRFATTKVATITGTLQGTQSSLSAKILAMENAYNVNGHDFGLYLDSGVATPHTILSRLSIGGTRVTQFDWLDGVAEYATGRTYQITVEADYLDGNNANQLVAYQETISFQGTGGPKTVLIQPQVGRAVTQITRQRSICRAVQSGSATGFLAYPAANPPIYPQPILLAESAQIQYVAPSEVRGTAFTNWTITWGYAFESPSPLFGLPRVR